MDLEQTLAKITHCISFFSPLSTPFTIPDRVKKHGHLLLRLSPSQACTATRWPTPVVVPYASITAAIFFCLEQFFLLT
jgi:hypothetical protein